MRLTRITTRTGDGGETGLADGSRLPKFALAIQALGDIDELNAHLGLALAQGLSAPIADDLARIQHHLFDLGSDIAVPGRQGFLLAHITWLDEQTARLNAPLPALKEFILPGGALGAAQLHVCRTVCRRSERTVSALHAHTPVVFLPYLNRLSDYLFIAARTVNQASGASETFWRPT